MASPRFSKFFKQMEENLNNLGYSKAKAKLLSVDANGNVIGWMNFSATSSNSGDLQFFIRIKPWEVAGLEWPAAMRTQLHAAGQYAEGSAMVELIVQASDDAAINASEAALHKFKMDCVHIVRGQQGAQVRLKITNHGTNPGASLISSGALVATVATWDAAGNDIGVLLPYGRSAAGTLG